MWKDALKTTQPRGIAAMIIETQTPTSPHLPETSDPAPWKWMEMDHWMDQPSDEINDIR